MRYEHRIRKGDDLYEYGSWCPHVRVNESYKRIQRSQALDRVCEIIEWILRFIYASAHTSKTLNLRTTDYMYCHVDEFHIRESLPLTSVDCFDFMYCHVDEFHIRESLPLTSVDCFDFMYCHVDEFHIRESLPLTSVDCFDFMYCHVDEFHIRESLLLTSVKRFGFMYCQVVMETSRMKRMISSILDIIII
ncbi:hypothetical protein E3N88_29294 [Mikania micrantha]|uniref:Uncharacterized protein n=1 Tax=Mikania micrantha TaxID=192012 RepID=A0A5N6MID8_9ASTR|nr:hypothetical protein E3N88_29294 [Mikania micrantha]